MHMEAARKEESGNSKPTRISSEASTSSSLESSRRPGGSSSSSLRTNGHPFKRYTVSNSLLRDNVAPKTRYSRKGDWVRLVLKSRELSGKASKISTEKGSRSSRRAWIIGIALVIAVCYLVAEVYVQGSLALLLKGTAAIAAEALAETRAHSFSLKCVPSEDVLEYKVKFVPSEMRERVKKQRRSLSESRKLPRSSFRYPRLALVCANLEATPEFLYLITLGKALKALGYEIEVLSLKDGPMRFAWESTGALVIAIPELDPTHQTSLSVDWLKYECVLLSSWNMKPALHSFMQDPFKEVPIVWILLEDYQEKDSEFLGSSQLNELLLKLFKRSDVVLLSEYVLAMRYSQFDTGNFYVIPGSPKYAWDTKEFISTNTREEIRRGLNLSPHDIAIAVVGSPFSYKSMWREHALILQAAAEVTKNGGFSLRLLFSSATFASNYKVALQIMSAEMGLVNGSVTYFGPEQDSDQLLLAADVVMYSSLREEQFLPTVMLKAMILDCPIIVPNMTIFKDYVHDGINGFMFQGGDRNDLTRVLVRVLSQTHAAEQPHGTASGFHGQVHELLVANIVSGFAELLEGLIQFPSEAHLPSPVSSLPENLKRVWQWQLLEPPARVVGRDAAKGDHAFLTNPGFVPEHYKPVGKVGHEGRGSASMIEKRDVLSRTDWREFKSMQLAEQMERSEEEQLSERNEHLRGTWEEVYRSVRRTENTKNELHEREDGELERTAQPICIYEPYFGAGTWQLLGQKSMMYRGISMIPRQRRAGSDDIEASLRLPLLNHSYYRDVLCDFGAFLAIANRIDRIHKNAWIGFQSWQAVGRKVSLSTRAEMLLYDAVNRGDSGDTVYFWASTELYQNSSRAYWDFWSYCDAINKGNCRQAFLSAFKEMYGLPSSWTLLPLMPSDGDHWSILHCWAMPTPSFMEFIMFSRMFVSALDSFYAEHHDNGTCRLGSSLSEVRHCYCRLLQLLINVWAYHSGRRMVLVDPVDGVMHEQHNLSSRHGQMWVNFFSYTMLKSMDGDLAEEADDGTLRRRWLWPRTGEVYCQQIQERERKHRYEMKLEKKKRDKERVRRIRGRQRQRPLARG